MKVLRHAVVLALLLAIPATVQAQYVETLDYTGHSGVTGGGNVYVGPYSGVLGGAAFDIYCVDGQNAHIPSIFDVYVTRINNPNLALATYSYYGSADKYAKAAWLTMQFGSNPTSSWNDIHQAIWNTVSNGIPGYDTKADPTQVANWESMAAANYGSINMSQWAVLHDVDHEAQEFLVKLPEPAALLLLLSGLVGIAGVVVRRQIL
jgi:hypothetical protein